MDILLTLFGNPSELWLLAWISLVHLMWSSVGACLIFVADMECKISLFYSIAMHRRHDACTADHVIRNPRLSPSVFAHSKRSKTGDGEGLGMRLVRYVVQSCSDADWEFCFRQFTEFVE